MTMTRQELYDRIIKGAAELEKDDLPPELRAKYQARYDYLVEQLRQMMDADNEPEPEDERTAVAVPLPEPESDKEKAQRCIETIRATLQPVMKERRRA